MKILTRKIPAAARILLDFIYETETSRKAPSCYETIYGHNENRLHKPITMMTLLDIQRKQMSWSKRFGSSATGAPQFMYKTLGGLIDEYKLDIQEVFTPALQDALAYALLKRRGYLKFVSGKISEEEFGKRLAQEWASFPVLATTKGGSRTVKRGQSYYAGDGLNKSLTAPETVEGILAVVFAVANKKTVTKKIPTPAPKPVTVPVVEKPAIVTEVEAPKVTTKPATGPKKGAKAFYVVIVAAVVSIPSYLATQACKLAIFSSMCGG